MTLVYKTKTYGIDYIDFTINPMSSLHPRKVNRDIITYMEYYKRNRVDLASLYSIQPLLVCRPSCRDVNRGDDQPVYLIPELCGMTWLFDQQW